MTDTELAREYELEQGTQYVSLGIYTLDVDYPDVAVQVRREHPKGNRPYHAQCAS